MDDVVFSHYAPNTDTGRWRIIHRDSPGGAGGEVCYRCYRSTALFSLFTTNISLVFAHRGRQLHHYTPMTVRCTSVLQFTRFQGPFPDGVTALQNVASWLSSSRLRLNQAKAALTWLQQSTQQMKKIGEHVVTILLSFITTVETVRDIGVIMDNDLTVSAHISSVCRPACCFLRSMCNARFR